MYKILKNYYFLNEKSFHANKLTKYVGLLDETKTKK